MDPQYGLASKDDLWRLQNEMKNVYATQAEHADRLMRLEQRQESDTRLKSAWGGQSPFPSVMNGTPQQGRPTHSYEWDTTDVFSVQTKVTILPQKLSRISMLTSQT